MITDPCNPNATKEVREVLEYLSSIEGKAILTGQHTQTIPQEELSRIEELTGELPAVCGFELLAYSPNIAHPEDDPDCIAEVKAAEGTMEKAFEWAERGGLVTLTWHWFSPLGGSGKAFYAKNTDFDATRVLSIGTPERDAFFADMDHMASVLSEFQDRHIPVLWRPFHESDGDWFWWGAAGPLVARDLYCLMFDYFMTEKELNNLIWVWNSALPEGYVGDSYCDIISRDIYPGEHVRTDFADGYESLKKITPEDKGCALAETGVFPDPELLESSHIPWLWFMTWSKEFVMTNEYNTDDAMKAIYASPYAVTLRRLTEEFSLYARN